MADTFSDDRTGTLGAVVIDAGCITFLTEDQPMKIEFPLSKAIKAHGEDVKTLELVEPTTKDVRELGYPFSATPGANGEADLKLFPEIGARYISRLAKIPMSSVDQILPGDFLLLHSELCGFFMASTLASSASESSMSPGSGE